MPVTLYIDVGFNACDPAGRARGAWGVSQHAHMERWTVQRYGIVGTAKEHGTKSMQGTIQACCRCRRCCRWCIGVGTCDFVFECACFCREEAGLHVAAASTGSIQAACHLGDLVPMHYDEASGGNFSTEAMYDVVDMVGNVSICVLS